MTMHYTLTCSVCGAAYEDDGFLLQCSNRHAPGLLHAAYSSQRLEIDEQAQGLYRYRCWLPISRTLAGNVAPKAYHSTGLAAVLQLANLWIVFSGYWPEKGATLHTTSFKELEAYAVLARGPRQRSRILALASAGNTAAAFARSCSENKIPCLIVVPASGMEKMRFPSPLDPCVKLVCLSGSSVYSDAISFVDRISSHGTFYGEGGVKNIGRRAGLGVAMLTATEAIGRLPDFYFQAIGSGAGAIAVHEAAKRLLRDGRYGDRLPRLMLSQNAPFTPVADAWKAGRRELIPMDAEAGRSLIRQILAPVLSNQHPPYSISGGLYDVLTESQGDTLTADNREAEAAMKLFERCEGIDIDPAAGVALASLVKAVEAGQVPRDALVLLHVTGGGWSKRMAEMKLLAAAPSLEITPQQLASSAALDQVYELFFPARYSVRRSARVAALKLPSAQKLTPGQHAMRTSGGNGMKPKQGLAAIAAAGKAPLDMDPEQFRSLGHKLVDRLADFLASLAEHPVAPSASARSIRERLDIPFPEKGAAADQLLDQTLELLLQYSTFNSHPRFWAYITGTPAPIGALGDFVAATLNPNLGKWILSPVGTEIEAQTVRWIAQMLGYAPECGGLLVSGGSAANFVGFLAARRAKLTGNVRSSGLGVLENKRLRLYTSAETHLWVQKAADMFGLGTDSIRWIPTDEQFRMDTAALRQAIEADLRHGDSPFLLVGTAGTTSTGAVDPLPELAAISREYGLWFHVDGAYGGFAGIVPDACPDLRGIAEADSVAVDPHKWLYAPLEAGCALVRDPEILRNTFSYRPQYYHLAEDPSERAINYFEYGPQNARGFRALKVWLCLRQAGLEGYRQMIGGNIRLSAHLYNLVKAHPELQAFTNSLSITTFRYVPRDLRNEADADSYLNQLNAELLTRLQKSGAALLSNAVIRGKFALRACIVNFRTTLADIAALPELVVSIGAEVDSELRPLGAKQAIA